MSLILHQADLRPAGLQPIDTKSSGLMRVPLTPYFHSKATSHSCFSRGFHGSSFALQNKSTNQFVEDLPDRPGQGKFVGDVPICGFSAYRFEDVERYKNTGNTTGTRSWNYVFNTSLQSVAVVITSTGDPSPGGITNTRTQTVRYLGNQYDSTPPYDWWRMTFSSPVDKAWLAAQAGSWMSQTEAFKVATGTGAGMYSFLGHARVETESDGYFGSVVVGNFRATSYLFSSTFPSVEDSEAARWDNNHDAWVCRQTRKNAPIVYTVTNSFAVNARRVSYSIYREGYSEELLFEEITENPWRDDYGVYDDGVDMLESVPKMAAGSFYDLSQFMSDGANGRDNELVLVSYHGDRLRITVEGYSTEYSGGSWSEVIMQTLVLTTDEETMRIAHRFTAPFTEGMSLRISLIEKSTPEGWVVVADRDDETNLPDAETQITATLRNPRLLMAYKRTRSGSRWGFTPLNFIGDTRYRRREFRKHWTVGTVNAVAGDCGDGTLTGAFDLEYSQEFDELTGLLQPEELGEFSLTVNGIDWTRETWVGSDTMQGAVQTIHTATHRRRETTGGVAYTGRFMVAFDAPDNGGSVIGEDWEKVAVTRDGSFNRTAWLDYGGVAAGQSVFYGGHRLTYGD